MLLYIQSVGQSQKNKIMVILVWKWSLLKFNLQLEGQFYANGFVDLATFQINYLRFQFLSRGMQMESPIQAEDRNRRISVEKKCDIWLEIAGPQI